MKKRNIFWGLLFIVAALLIILNQFGLFIGISMFELVATIVLIGVIIKSAIHLNYWGVLFPLAFICILYADEWHIQSFTPWPALLTALLLSIGLSMLFQNHHNWWMHHAHHHNSFGSSVINEKDESIVKCSSSFGECMKYINSESLERAEIDCSFGEVKVYFDNALIPSGKADIYVNVSFGSAILYIPKSWQTICKANVFLGDMKDNGNTGSGYPVVTIHGSVSFGDIKVIYV